MMIIIMMVRMMIMIMIKCDDQDNDDCNNDVGFNQYSNKQLKEVLYIRPVCTVIGVRSILNVQIRSSLAQKVVLPIATP